MRFFDRLAREGESLGEGEAAERRGVTGLGVNGCQDLVNVEPFFDELYPSTTCVGGMAVV